MSDAGTTSWVKGKRGDWLVRSAAGMVLGGVVAVSKRDGTTKEVRLGRQVWSDGKVSLYTADAIKATVISSRPGRGMGCGCDCGNCSPCRCESHCNCRGGNVYDC